MGNFDFESGRRYLEEGDLVEGIRCFLASLDVDPDHTQTYVELFRAYTLGWEETGDPDVLDQMRKVAIAGLRRNPTDAQRRFLEEGLDMTEERIIESMETRRAVPGECPAGTDSEEDRPKVRRLPLIDS